MCPLVNIGLQKQEQSASAGSKVYPSTISQQKSSVFVDSYDRTSLNPTGAYELYTEAAAGAGVATFANSSMILTTGGTIGNDVDIRTANNNFMRQDFTVLDNRTEAQLEIVFNLAANTDTEGYIGMIIADTSALTALPTTVRNFGIFWNRSASTNFFLTSANGSDQVTTDTGVALSTASFLLRLTWTETNTVIIEFLSSSGSDFEFDVLESTVTVTALGLSQGTINSIFHFFIQTEASATKALHIDGFRVNYP